MSVNKFSKKSNRVVLDTQHLFTYIVYLKQAFDNINRPLDKIYAKVFIITHTIIRTYSQSNIDIVYVQYDSERNQRGIFFV